ncbi:unnamed protein product [marine sediment metagenome]|uniref:Uncharacterized protein n=1 Tax=marine sediment metagenome TaxID=412755 RepID=X0WDB2_9ZZZZ
MVIGDSWQLRGKIKKVIKFVSREGFYCPDEEFLIDIALAFSHPVNLTHRYFHSLG